jgi:hypothetical protein
MKLNKIISLIVFCLLIFGGHKAFADDTNAAPTHFQIETLKSILADADQAAKDNDQPSRTKYLQEFLKRSDEIGDISTLTNIWILRAAAAIELNDDQKSWEAGQKLLQFHLDNSDDPKVQKIMVALNRKDLLGLISPEAKAQAEQQRLLDQQREAADKAQLEQQRLKHETAAKYVGTWKFTGDGRECEKVQGILIITADPNLNLTASGHYSLKGTRANLSASGEIDSIENTSDLPDDWQKAFITYPTAYPYMLVGNFNYVYAENNLSDTASKALFNVNEKQLTLFIVGNDPDNANKEYMLFEKE